MGVGGVGQIQGGKDQTEHRRLKVPGLGLPYRSSGQDSALPMQGAWAQSLVRELSKIPHAVRYSQKKKKVPGSLRPPFSVEELAMAKPQTLPPLPASCKTRG